MRDDDPEVLELRAQLSAEKRQTKAMQAARDEAVAARDSANRQLEIFVKMAADFHSIIDMLTRELRGAA